MSQYTRTIEVTWNDVDSFIQEVVQQYKGHTFTGVYGIPRGGLVFAVMLSHAMHIPLLQAPVKGCLIVDDISDTGRTLTAYKGRYTTATMYQRHTTSTPSDYHMTEVHDDAWIHYPWEAER